MGQGSIQPGDLLPVARDVLREQTLLFRAGDAVTVLALWEDPQAHGLYYLAQSPLTGEHWYLCEADLLAASPSEPPSPPPPAHYQHVGLHEAPASHPQAAESPAAAGIRGRLATYVLIVTVVILYILGGAMLLFFIWPANEALAGIGKLFFPFGFFIVLLPTFLLLTPVAQRTVASHEYDREREQILTEHAGAFEAAYGSGGAPVPPVTLPTGRERCLCWRCGADNAEGSSTCANCGAHFNYDWILKLIPVNTYTSTLFIWATMPVFILFPFFLGNTFSDEFQRFYLFFYLLCFLMYVVVLALLVGAARFNFTQAAVSYALSPLMPISMIYVHQNAQKNMGRERSMDLNHFRRGDGRVNTWGAMKEKQLRGIIIAFYCDTGKLFKAKPAKRLRYLKWGAQIDPLDHRMLYHLAREQFASGNRMLGFYELDNALRLFPGHEQYVEMRVAMKSGGMSGQECPDARVGG